MSRKKVGKALPKIVPKPGSVHAEMKRCGRAGCRCANGELHGPYYYRFFRVRGKLRKRYVRPEDVASVSAGCKAHQEQQARKRHIVRQSQQEWRRLMAAIRQMEQEGTLER